MTPGEFAAMLRLQEQIQREYVKFAPMVREAVKLKRDHLAMWHRQKEGTPTSGAERVSRFLPGPTLLQSFRRPRLEHHDKESQPNAGASAFRPRLGAPSGLP